MTWRRVDVVARVTLSDRWRGSKQTDKRAQRVTYEVAEAEVGLKERDVRNNEFG